MLPTESESQTSLDLVHTLPPDESDAALISLVREALGKLSGVHLDRAASATISQITTGGGGTRRVYKICQDVTVNSDCWDSWVGGTSRAA